MYIYQSSGGNADTIDAPETTGGISVHCYFQGCCLSENTMPSFSAYQANTGQTGIVKNTYTKALLPNTDWDIGSDLAANVWTPGTEGYYVFTAKVWLDSDGGGTATGDLLAIALYKNGEIYKQAEIRYSGTGTFQGPTLCCSAYANGTDDYFEFYIYHKVTTTPQKTVTTGDVGVVKQYCYFQACGIDASTEITGNVMSFEDQLATKPTVSYKAKMKGGLTAVNKLDVNILNQELMSDHFSENTDTYKDPENSEVKAYLVLDSGTTLLADAIQFFRGMIDDFPTIDYDSVKISCTSIDTRVFKDKIGVLVTDADSTSGYALPEESLGRIKPIVYGEHRFGINYTKDNNQLAANYPFSRENNVVKAVSLGGGEFLLAGHKVSSIEDDADGIWLFDDMLGRLVEVNDYTVTKNDASGCIINVTGITTLASDNDGVTSSIPDALTSAAGDFVNDGVEIGHTLVIESGRNIGKYIITYVDAGGTSLGVTSGGFSTTEANIDFRIEKHPNFNDWRSPKGASTSDSWANIDRLHDLSISLAATVTQAAGAGPNEELVTVEFDAFPYSLNLIKVAKVYVKGNYDDDDGEFDLAVNHSNGDNFAPGRTNTTQFHTHLNDLDLEHLNNCHLGYIKGTS